MRDEDIMQSNFVQDPESIQYENLFFWLSLGKYDTVVSNSFKNYHYEEFMIVSEEWKERVKYLENLIPIQTHRFIRELEGRMGNSVFFSVDFRIYFVIYTTSTTRQLLGLGIRIITPSGNSNVSSALALTPEDRLQKIMYLLSRGLLRSFHHRIDQIECPIPV